jgi:ABC-type transport system involved in cytochrome c biogenesis permease subunit
MVNSTEPEPAPADFVNPATAGDGKRLRAQEKREGTGVDADQRIDMASAYVTFWKKGTDENLGTYLVSIWQSALTDQPQKITVDGRDYDVYLRFKRNYKPYTVTLEKFTHDVYPGTMTPKNFASTVHLVDPLKGMDLETTISMNNPLRYNGETFYQSSFLPGDSGTILQVVRNPGWTMPYISCLMVGLGMLIHFGITLWKFLSTKVAVGTIDLSWPSLLAPALVAGFGVLYICLFLMPPQDVPGAMRIHDFDKLPIVDGGRPKPIETFAHNRLQMIANKGSFKGTDGEIHDAIRWFLDAATSRLNKNSTADSDEIFRIDNDQVLNLLELPVKPENLRYSIKEMAPKFAALQKEAERSQAVEQEKRTLFDVKVLELTRRIQVYIDVVELKEPNLLPEVGGKPSRNLIEALRAMKEKGEKDVDAESMGNMLFAYAQNDPKEFNQELDKYHARLASAIPVEVKKAEFEVFFNDFEPFYHCTELYVAVFLLGIFSWIGFRTPLARSAFFLCLVTLVLHTWAIGARMYIQDRPPVTNLYSSAIFVGWGCVLLGLILEVIFRNSFGVVLAAVTGFLSTVIAHNLATDGDTLEMMQAVLDTNFWLATHVVIINIGYAATVVAGGVGATFILAAALQHFTQSMRREQFLALNRMMYGILCFATLTSFVGTVLGGIWADQSWGRFWGWDPKENGALMIVIMNALILHARWGGIVQQRGMAVLGLCGNILTSWSWFGVNLLGVGLHAYAGQTSTKDWLLLFIASQVGLIILGLMPFLNCWKTAAHDTPVKLPPPDSPVLRKRGKRGGHD